MTSIRRTLTFWLLGAMGSLVLVSAVGLFLAVRTSLVRQFDQALMSRVSALMAASHWDGEKVEVDFASEAMPWYLPGPEAEYFEVRQKTGDQHNTLLRSASLASRPWETGPADQSAGKIADTTLPDGAPGRMATVLFRPPTDEELTESGQQSLIAAAAASSPEVVIVAARSREDLDQTLRVVVTALAAAGLLLGAGVVGAVRFALSRGLRPLDKLGADVQRIGAESLSRRLDAAPLPAELLPVCRTLNELLERLESAFARERRFTAAAAHELRTPVAELRSLLEVSLSRPRSAEDSRGSLEEGLAVTLQMERTIETLFQLARHESGQKVPDLGPVVVGSVLERLRDRHAPFAQARAGCIRLDASPGLAVMANPAMLEVILENVLANAVEYAQPGPDIGCSAAPSADTRHVRIDVTNPVAGVADAARFFEPFWRRSDSRSDRSHLGLGLTLARRLAEVMGGTLTAEAAGPDSLRVRLTLPSAVLSAENGHSLPALSPA